MTVFANGGDLHLSNQNIRSTLHMPEASTGMLQSLYQELVNETAIQIFNFLGDIQHITPKGKNTLQKISEWDEEFLKIGNLMTERFKALIEQGETSIEIVGRDGENMITQILNGEKKALFTLRGNHDIDNEDVLTYYDYLIEKGYLCEPRYMILDGVQINYHHYGEAETPIPKQANAEKVVGLYHNTLHYEEMPFWTGKGEDVIHAKDVLCGVDVAIVGHIHNHYEPIVIRTTDGGTSIIYVQGAMGRTQFVPDQLRDVGYVSVLDTQNIAEIGTLEVPIMEAAEYFNMRYGREQQVIRRDFRDFALTVEQVHARPIDARDLIQQMNIEEAVKAKCNEYLTAVIEGVED